MSEKEFEIINDAMSRDSSPDILGLFSRIPLDEFVKLLLDVLEKYQDIRSFFPSKASGKVQKNWTGADGLILPNQS